MTDSELPSQDAPRGLPSEPASQRGKTQPIPRKTRPLKRLKIFLISWLVYAVVRTIAATYRYRFLGEAHRDAAATRHPNEAFVLALWHEHLFAAICGLRGQGFAPLASLSSDGDVVTFVLQRLGYPTTRGSSSRGGEQARDELVIQVAEGLRPALTVDGPRGPRRRVKGGIVDIARRTGTWIVPFCAVADRTWIFSKSWDRFQIPKPFARVTLSFGPPVPVPANARGLSFGNIKQEVLHGLVAAEDAGDKLR